ncbi:MAG: N-6 DNA methylase [Verrucomicrobiota bacterium]
MGSFLWSAAHSTPDLLDSLISNRHYLEAVHALAFVQDNNVRRAVDYKNLGSEELGSVYQGLLEMHPRINADAGSFELDIAAGNERKTSGSYYTPDSLVQCLLDSALEPVIAERLAMAKMPKEKESALLSLKVCDMAAGSGHFIIRAGHRIARHLARVRSGEEEPSPTIYRTALRDVIGHCLYGVDINPMAVELCKVTLWLEALEPGKPLSFLDHHIRCGNSLLGATPELIKCGIPEDAYTAIEGDDKEACAVLKKKNKRENPKLGQWFVADEALLRDKLYQAAAAIDEISDNRPEDIRRKEAAFHAEQTNYDFQRAWDLANLWCAAFVIKKQFVGGASVPTSQESAIPDAISSLPAETQSAWFDVVEKSPKAKSRKPAIQSLSPTGTPFGVTTQHLRDFVAGGELPDGLIAEAKKLGDQYQFFHWHLVFPEVFKHGGFDLLIGNPPWDMVELSEKEFFASRDLNIAEAPTARRRQELIRSLSTSNPQLFRLFSDSKRQVYGIRHFVQNSGHFPYSSTGRINMYPLFVERTATLIAPRGRSGIVVPSAISMDAYNAQLFSWLIEDKRLVSLYDFDNTFGLFPEVDSRFRFCLLTTTGANSGLSDFAFCFYAHETSELRIPERLVRLTFDQILSFSPNTLAPPMFMNAKDGALSKLVYGRCGVLANHRTKQNLWQISIQRMLSLSDPGDIFRRSTELEDGEEYASPGLWMRLHSGKAIHQYEHRFATFEGKDWRVVQAAEQKRSDFVIRTEYYARSEEVASRLSDKSPNNWLLVYRDVTNATNERTSIAAIIPQSGCDTTCRNLFSPAEPRNIAAFLSCLNSFCFDYFVRQKVIGMHLGAGVFEQLPALPPQQYDRAPVWTQTNKTTRDWLLPRVLELTYTAWDLEAFAQDCGWSGPPFRWDEDRRFLLRCELDAAFFHLYLGPETEWRQQPAALTQAFPTPRDAVAYILDTFPIVKRKDEAKFKGDYRTKRVILEIYDALATAMLTGQAYQTRLNPASASLAVAHLPRFDRERFNFKEAGDYILPFVASLLRHQGGECDVMILIRAYAMLLGDRKTLTTLTEARFGAEAGTWVKQFNQPVDASWFLPVLRGLDNRDVIKLEERGENDVFVRLLDASVPSNSTVETDVYLLLHVLDLNAAPAAAVAEQVKHISPKTIRTSIQEAKLAIA